MSTSTSSTDQAARIVWGPTESGADDPVMVWARVWRYDGGTWEGETPKALPRETGLAWVLDTIEEQGVVVEIYPTERAAAISRTRDRLTSVCRDDSAD